MKYIKTILAFAALCLTGAMGTVGINGGPVFTPVRIGGAGAAFTGDSYPSAGLLLARTDQYGCYLSISNGRWKQLVRTNNMPIGVASIDSATGGPTGLGCGAAIFDHSNSLNIWIETQGDAYFSSDQGAHFVRTCYPHQADQGPSQSQSPATQTKEFQHFFAADPNNSNIVYMATLANGLIVTYNQGLTCSTISAVGTGGAINSSSTHGGHLIAFDTSGSTTTTCPGGATICTKNIYVSTYGTGVYKSTDGGFTWSLQNSAGMPTTHVALKTDGFGNLFFIDDSNNNGLGVLHKYTGSAWSIPSGGPQFGAGIDIDPNNCASAGACHIGVWEGGGFGGDDGVNFSITGGSSWNKASTLTFTSTDVPWLGPYITASTSFFPSGAMFDNSGNLYTGAEGFFFTVPQSASTGISVTSQTVGIEESLGSALATSPSTSGFLNIGTWDVNCFVNLAQPFTSFPTTANRGCGTPNSATLAHTYALDWSSANTDFFIALTDNQGGTYTGYSATSSNKGVTWTTLPTVPARISLQNANAGCMTAASSTSFMWAPNDGNSGNIPPFYTTDGGNTWANISITNEVGTLTTSAQTTSGKAILFSSVPAWVLGGSVMTAHDQSNNSAIPQHSTIVTVSTTGINLSNAVAQTVNSGDTILISGPGWPFRTVNRAKICAADRVNIGTYYFYNFGTASTGVGAVVKCTGGGTSCSLGANPNLNVDNQFGGILKSVPGQAGWIFLATGDWPSSSTNGKLVWSSNGGASFTEDDNFGSIMSFGFGAAFPGHTFPAIVVVGWRNGQYGIWQSIDFDGAKTWRQIGTYPNDASVFVEDVDGDKVIPNVFYYSTNSGVYCSSTNTAYCN